MTQYFYTNTASVAALSAPINDSAPSVSLSSFSGWPSTYPFWAIIERGTVNAEIVIVTNVVGSTATITRGQDNTLAASHNAGVAFEHIIPASLPNRAEAHMEATTGVHGASGSVVGTSGAQTLTDKTYRGGFTHAYADALPVTTVGFEVTASTAAAKDGFKHTNTGADDTRRGFLLEQSGTPRFEVFNDGTERVTPNTSATNPAYEARVGAAKPGLRVANTDAANATTFEVTGDGDTAISGTLGVTGASTLAAISGTTATLSGNATVGGTLGVTGNVTAGSALSVAGSTTLSGSLAVTGSIAAQNRLGIYNGTSPVVAVVGSTSDVDSPAVGDVVLLSSDGTIRERSALGTWLVVGYYGSVASSGFARYFTNTVQSIPNNVTTAAKFHTVVTSSADVTASGTDNTIFTLNRAGVWLISATCVFASGSGYRAVSISNSAMTTRYAEQAFNANATSATLTTTTTRAFSAGNAVSVGLFQSSGGALDTLPVEAMYNVSFTWLRP